MRSCVTQHHTNIKWWEKQNCEILSYHITSWFLCFQMIKNCITLACWPTFVDCGLLACAMPSALLDLHQTHGTAACLIGLCPSTCSALCEDVSMVTKMKAPMPSISAASSFHGGSYANCDEGCHRSYANRNGIPKQDFRIILNFFRSSVCFQLVSWVLSKLLPPFLIYDV